MANWLKRMFGGEARERAKPDVAAPPPIAEPRPQPIAPMNRPLAARPAPLAPRLVEPSVAGEPAVPTEPKVAAEPYVPELSA